MKHHKMKKETPYIYKGVSFLRQIESVFFKISSQKLS